MKRKLFFVILFLIFVELEKTDGLLDIPQINLKPVIKTATNLVTDIAEFTLNEILNFRSFKSLFRKVYATAELENVALLNFLNNQRDVDRHNEKYNQGLVSFIRGLCEFSDMSTEEMNKLVNRFKKPNVKRNASGGFKEKGKFHAKVNVNLKQGTEDPEETEGDSDDLTGKDLENPDKFEIEEDEEEVVETEEFEHEETEEIEEVEENTEGTDEELENAEGIDEELENVEGIDEEFENTEGIDEELENAEGTDEEVEDFEILDENSIEIEPENELPHPDSIAPEEDLEPLVSIHSTHDILNYVTKGFDNPVLNQGLCGSCWSFAATAAIEAAYFLKTGELIKLSEQQLIDCNRDHENEGCDGGNMVTAFSFLQDYGGISLNSRYPYKGNDTFACKDTRPHVEVLSHELIDAGDEELLVEELRKNGPIAVAIDASLKSFQTYKRGIYFDPNCTTEVNHAMLLVGYGTDTETGEDYWILKNTYGRTWGIDGYMKLARNRDNHCGIAEFAVYPICS